MIKISDLNFSYESEKILENINFCVEKNEFVGIIGANGGGKSTLLKLILGLLKPSSGEITLNCQKIAYVPQASKLNPTFPINVLDVVLMGVLKKNAFFFTSKKQKAAACECLKMVNMSEFASRRFKDLSGGQQQRVLIARAMLAKSDLILLDEPTASIDAKGQIEIFEQLAKLNKNGVCIVCVCHDVALLSAYANKIIHIQKTCHVHKNEKIIDKNRLLHMAMHKNHLCEFDIWSEKCSY